MLATLQHLMDNEGMDKATKLVVSGDSAGGLATYWHADAMQKILNSEHEKQQSQSQSQSQLAKSDSCHVLAVPDHGFFLEDKSKPAWPEALNWMVTAMNSTSGLDQSCVKAQSDWRRCTLPEVVSKYIGVPLFVVNSRYYARYYT